MEQVINSRHSDYSFKKNIYLYIAFVSMAVISSYKAFFAFDAPFPGILVCIVCLLLHCFVNDFPAIKFGTISCLLSLRLFLFLINSLVLSVSLNIILEQIVTTFLSVLVFESFRSSSQNNTVIIKNVLLIFSLITSVQLIYGFVGDFFSDKNDIVAGIGNSNYAATFLLLAIVFLLFIKTKWFEKLIILIDIVSLLLTQSFGAYLSFLIIFVVYIIKRFNWHLFRSWVILLLCIIIFAIVASYLLNTELGQEVYDKIKTKISYLFSGDFKNFGSSRLELYEFSWNNIKSHLFFGTVNNFNINIDEGYRYQNFRTHNFVLESLLLYGLIGTAINVVLSIFLIKKILNKKKSINVAPYVLALIAVIIHGLIEPNFFTMHFEPFVWMILGGLMSKVEKVK